MPQLQLIGVPYDLHYHGVRMGATPAALLPRLVSLPLPWAADPVLVAVAHLPDDEEVALAQLAAALAVAVRSARNRQALPVVIGGDCLVALGVVGGLDGAATGVVWIDAHGDFNTPATSPSGYRGGMPLAALAGHCLPEVTLAAELAAPIATDRIALLGVRDLDVLERAALDTNAVAWRSTVQLRTAPEEIDALLGHLGTQGPVYLHLDLDVLDPSLVPGVVYPAPDGLVLAELEQLLRAIWTRCDIAAISITALNVTAGDPQPALDTAVTVAQAALDSTA